MSGCNIQEFKDARSIVRVVCMFAVITYALVVSALICFDNGTSTVFPLVTCHETQCETIENPQFFKIVSWGQLILYIIAFVLLILFVVFINKSKSKQSHACCVVMYFFALHAQIAQLVLLLSVYSYQGSMQRKHIKFGKGFVHSCISFLFWIVYWCATKLN